MNKQKEPSPQSPQDNTPTSEGEGHISTSEGGNMENGDIVKKCITGMSTATIPKHPSLYSSLPTTPTKENRRFHTSLKQSRRTQPVTPIENQKIKKLIQQYQTIPKLDPKSKPSKHTPTLRRQLHRSPLSYIPISKHYKPSKPTRPHPMLLSKRYNLGECLVFLKYVLPNLYFIFLPERKQIYYICMTYICHM